MLGALIPVSDSLRTSGGSELIAGWLGQVAHSLPSYGAIALIMITAMAVTPFLNNAATCWSWGRLLSACYDAWLQAGSLPDGGCHWRCSDFLTPVGHQCNTLVHGPGGYRFSDYPRLGLPLSFIIVLVGVPALMWFGRCNRARYLPKFLTLAAEYA